MNSFSVSSSSAGVIFGSFTVAYLKPGLSGSWTQSRSLLLPLSTRFDFWAKDSEAGASSRRSLASCNFEPVTFGFTVFLLELLAGVCCPKPRFCSLYA